MKYSWPIDSISSAVMFFSAALAAERVDGARDDGAGGGVGRAVDGAATKQASRQADERSRSCAH